METIESIRIPGKRARTRYALVEAALTMVAEQGPEAASIDDLVRRAGLARGTFYNYFQSWDEVLSAVAAHMDERFHQSVESRLQPDWDAPTTLACLVRGFIQTGIDDPRLGWAWARIGGGMHWLLANRPPTRRSAEIALGALIGDRMSPTAAFCLLAGTAFMTLRRVLEGLVQPDEIESIIGMTLRGLGAPGAQIAPALRIAREFAAPQKSGFSLVRS